MGGTQPNANALISAVASFGFADLPFSGSSISRIRRNFSEASVSEDAKRYLSGSLAISAILSLPAFAALILLDFSPAVSFGGMLLFLSASFGALYLLPSVLAFRARSTAESELPFIMREFSIYLDVKIPFEQCIRRIGQAGYFLSADFLSADKAVRSGSTVQSALLSIHSKYFSIPIKRCILLLCTIYETGGSSEPLKRASEELSASQLSLMRIQSARLSVLSLLFIATSALLPSFFMVFAAAAPLLSQSTFSEWQVWAAFCAVFPALNALSLGAMLLFLPPSLPKQPREDFLDELLEKSGFRLGKRAFAAALALSSLSLCAFFFFAGMPAFSLLSLSAAPAIYFLLSYLSRSEAEKAEQFLPDALYTAASTHRLLSAERMISLLARGGFGRLSEAFAIALRRQKAGESFQSSMAAAAAHCPTPLVRRCLCLLTVCYETGADMYFALREAASDVVSFFLLVRERAALLAIQRYTVLAASALLVPLILGTVAALVPAISKSLPSSNAALPALLASCQIYLLLNALSSSIFLSLAESSPWRFALYFAICAPASLLAFSLASSGALSFF
ncbi:MAG: hypothetical protein N3E51_02140 [Candidatus Micrarchaeota archaeon]|nr:hypothetical protein [Candidatus Micrarchaeota archaeon]